MIPAVYVTGYKYNNRVSSCHDQCLNKAKCVWPESDVLTDDFLWNVRQTLSVLSQTHICLTTKAVLWMAAVHHCSWSSLRRSTETSVCSLSEGEISHNDDVTDSSADHAAVRTSRWEVVSLFDDLFTVTVQSGLRGCQISVFSLSWSHLVH